MYKVTGYITFYQDFLSLQACIQAIKSQSYPIQHLIIVDNSPKPLLQDYLQDKSITLLFYPENIGISGGLKIAIEWAIANNYDFLWTFDQDSQPAPNLLEKLLETYQEVKSRENIGIIAPLPVDKMTGQKWHGIDFNGYQFREVDHHKAEQKHYFCDAVITSGSLISIPIAKQVALPDENFFIDAVDWEYCWKFRQNNYDIVVAQNAILDHRFGNSKQIKIFPISKLITIYNYSPLRYYYIHRNYTYLETRLALSNRKLVFSIIRRLQFLLILIIKITFFEPDQTLLKIWACLKGTYDGFAGKLGKTWQ